MGRLLLGELTPLVGAQQGVIYQKESEDGVRLRLLSSYAGDGANGHPQQLDVVYGRLRQKPLFRVTT